MIHYIDKNSHSNDVIMSQMEAGSRYIIKRSYENKQRLIKCAHLQMASANTDKEIQPVPIISITSNEKFSEIKMPYIYGLSGENLYVYVSPEQLLTTSKRLVDSVFIHLENPIEKMDNKNFKFIIRKKINQVSKILGERKSVTISPLTFEQLANELNSLLENSCFECPVGSTHGDLTFSNIIIEPDYRKIWLIDFLDSFIASPYADLAKLIQEFKYAWSARYLAEPLRTSASIFGSHAMDHLTSRLHKYDRKLLKIFSLINLYRIAPYVKDKVTLDWLERALKREIECEY